MKQERIQKIIANAGYCSRRKAEEIITAGRVKVNGLVVTLGSSCSPDDDIEIDGIPLRKKEENHYLVMNKPVGYICSRNDPQGRDTIYDLVPKRYGSLYSVGRLDLNSSGLLILTDDGYFSNLVMHPASSPEKEYIVEVEGGYHGDEIELLAKGLYIIREGYTARPALCKLLKEGKNKCTFSVTIKEGKKREVRRMMQTLEHKVITLRRVRIGNIHLGDLKEGKTRELTKQELNGLISICTANKKENKK